MAGRARTAGVPDEPGRRCDLDKAVPAGRTGNDLGRGGRIACVDGKIRSTASALYGLEKRVCAGADGEGATARKAQPDAVWTHVRTSGNQNHSGRLAGGERPRGAQSRHASGPLGEEVKAQEDRHARGGESIS